MAGLRTRTELQDLFKAGAKPSGEDFKDFINSVLNIGDDGIEKPAQSDSPLKILVRGQEENVLDFYKEETLTWRINQTPQGASQPGLNFTAADTSKLFVESGRGNVGIGTIAPAAKLHILQTANQAALRIEDEAGDTTPLVVDASGNLGLGVSQPDKKLHIAAGELKVMASHSNTTADIATFQAQDGKNGLGIGADRLVAIGSNANQAIYLIPKGTGQLIVGGNGLQVTAAAASAVAGSLSIGKTLSVGQGSSLIGSVGIGIAADTAHKLTVYDGDLAFKVANNANAQSILFQNSGGAYTWRIYRQDIGSNKADLKIAGGADSDATKLTDYLHIQNNGNIAISKDLAVGGSISGKIDASQMNSGTLAVDRIPNLSADKITSGTLNTARIPNLSANKITSGTLNTARIPNLSANKITSGTLNTARIPNLSADKITSGTLNTARIPNLSANKITSGTLNTARIPNLSASKITGGTISADLTVNGTLKTKIVNVGAYDLSAHVSHDGAFYRKGGQAYISVDDNFYIRDTANSNDNIKFHFDTNSGDLKIGRYLVFSSNNYKPFQLRKYTGGDNPRIETAYSSADWVVIIAGFKTSSKGDAEGQYVYAYVSNNKWWIAADVVGTTDKSWEINILAIRKGWVYERSRI